MKVFENMYVVIKNTIIASLLFSMPINLLAMKKEYEAVFVDVDMSDIATEQNGTLLHRAIRNNEKTNLLDLIKNFCINIDDQDQEGYTALHLAVFGEKFNMVNSLLKVGARIGSKNTVGETPLHTALGLRNYKIIRLLLNARDISQIINTPDDINQETPLHVFVKNLCSLLDFEAQIAPNCPRGVLDEDHFDSTQALDLIPLFFEKGANPYPKNSQQKTAVNIACEQNHRELAKTFKDLYEQHTREKIERKFSIKNLTGTPLITKKKRIDLSPYSRKEQSK